MTTVDDAAQLAAITASLEQQVADGLLEKVGPDQYRLTDAGKARVEAMFKRRTWLLPAEPGPEVKAVRDADGDRWDRNSDGGWFWASDDGKEWAEADWPTLLANAGPLTDATGEQS